MYICGHIIILKKIYLTFLLLLAVFFVSACERNMNFRFVSWGKVSSSEKEFNSFQLKDIVIDNKIYYVCQLSPYFFLLEDHQDFQGLLMDNNLLPVPEGFYLFAYFTRERTFVGSDMIAANSGDIRPSISSSNDYVCVSSDDGILSAVKYADYVSFSLHQ